MFAAPACNGYEGVLSPPHSVKDVCYHINRACVDAGINYVCINAAVEESLVAERDGDRLLAHDIFVRDRLAFDDILIVSVGGNDVALRPNSDTQHSLAMLYMTPKILLRNDVGFGKVLSCWAIVDSLSWRVC